VSGIMAGASTDGATLQKVKDAIPKTAVFANTGCNIDSIENILSVADGAVVGTTFKYDGKFENHVDIRRVRAFMEKVRSVR
jgi:predicted TIM-barrel enzyme